TIDLIGDDAVHATREIVPLIREVVDSPDVEAPPFLPRLTEHAVVKGPVLDHNRTASTCARQVADLEAHHIRRLTLRVEACELTDQLPIQGLDHVGAVRVEDVQLIRDATGVAGRLLAVRLQFHQQSDADSVGGADELLE